MNQATKPTTIGHTCSGATLAEIRARDGARAFRGAEVGAIDAEARTVQLAFSSEVEVERWFGHEILSHDPEAVVLTRLNDGAALLLEHDRDKQIGVVQSVSIDADRRGRCVVRFGRSARAEEIFQDIVDGIRRHVSVGYRIHDAKLVETRDDGDVWKVTKWEPFEISVVSVPADVSVGVGRAMEADQPGERAETGAAPEPEQEDIMSGINEAETKPAPDAAPAAGQDAGRRALEAERARSRAIIEMGEAYGAAELARDAVKDGLSAEQFQRQLLEHLNSRMQQPLSEQMRTADIGLTEKEVRNFSFLKVIRALADPTNHAARREAAFEFEASEAAAAKRGKGGGERFAVPSDVLHRALNTATSGSSAGDTGGFVVANPLLASSFIDILRNRSTIMQLGNVLGGLVGNPDIPKQTAGAQGYWVGEDQDASQGNQTLGQIGLTPKTCAAFSEITRRLMMQSSIDVEALVRADLAMALALTIDKAGYYGTGENNQPKGILKHTGVNAVSFAAANPSFAELVDMETQIAIDNADVSSMAYVTNAKMRGYAKTALKHEGIAGTIWEQGGTINGYRTEVTNQIEDGHVFMGNFSDLIIGMWGGLDLTVDPYSGSKSGRLRIVVFQDVDFALRRVESFCIGKNG